MKFRIWGPDPKMPPWADAKFHYRFVQSPEGDGMEINMYRGHIYNNDGIPLSGIKISDGQNITVSDECGAYSLPGWDRAHVISVQALTMHHDDWYRYIDKDHNEYDFYVTPYAGGEDCSFFHFSDSEIYIDGASPEIWVGGIKELTNEIKPDFIVHTGDICRRKGLEGHRYAMNSDNMGIPVRYTLGNHDYVNDKYGEYTFERLYGPVWYSFDLGRVHFVILPIDHGEVPGCYTKDDSLRWLKNDLEAAPEGMRTVFLCHGPCNNFESDFMLKGDTVYIDMKDCNAIAWIFGHLHVHYMKEVNGRFHIGTGRPDFGGIDGTPAGCRVVRISRDHELTTELVYVKKNTDICEAKRRIIAKGFCFSSPIYAESKVFVASFDDGYPRNCSVMALDKSGEIVWKYNTDSSVKWNIEYENGVIYAKDDFGTLYAISAKDGSLIRKKKLFATSSVATAGGLTVKDGKIYIGTNERVYVIDAANAKPISESNYVDPSSFSALVPPVIFGGGILWGKHWRGLICTDEKSGETLWQNKDVIDFIAEPIVVDDVIYAPTRYRISKLDKNGNILCESERKGENFFNSTSTPVYFNGKLFVPTTKRGVGVYDAERLELITYIETSPSLIAAAPYNPIGEQTVFGKPIIEADTLIFAAADGNVYF